MWEATAASHKWRHLVLSAAKNKDYQLMVRCSCKNALLKSKCREKVFRKFEKRNGSKKNVVVRGGFLEFIYFLKIIKFPEWDEEGNNY